MASKEVSQEEIKALRAHEKCEDTVQTMLVKSIYICSNFFLIDSLRSLFTIYLEENGRERLQCANGILCVRALRRQISSQI
jgi:hypothetical protein